MRGRRKRSGRVLVVPFGTGIGDTVSMRPLLQAVVAAHPVSRVDLLCSPSMAWLLPPGVHPVRHVHGVPPWRRIAADGVAARLAANLTVPAAARLLRPLTSPVLTRALTSYLELQEYPTVYNLLEAITRVERLHRARRPGDDDGGTLIDHMAAALEERGVKVPPASRAPRLDTVPRRLAPGPTALISPCAGSTLKEPPPALWREVIDGLAGAGVRTYLLAAPRRPIDPLLAAAPGITVVRRRLPQLPPLLAGAGVVLSPDSGTLHLAAAVGAPYVGLFGATDARLTGPRPRPNGILLQAPADHPPVCGDCWTAQLLPSARCPVHPGTTCLSTFSSRDVTRATLSLLRSG